MEKTEILKHLQKFIESKQHVKCDKKTARLYSVLQSIHEEHLSLGNLPNYFFAYLECNSTGVGRSSFEGCETQRTVARDYVTDEYLFVDGHIGTCEKGLSLFFLKPNQTIHYHQKGDIIKLAKRYGMQLHAQYFSDLNFRVSDHRLNRHTVQVTQGPFSYPIRPIFATISKKGEKITVGYVYEKDGKEHIIIEPEMSRNTSTSENSGCTSWMFLSIIFPPLLIVVFFFYLFQSQKERMIG